MRFCQPLSIFASRLAQGALVASVCLAALAPAYAEDIDIFEKEQKGKNVPNVLILLDNSSNWSSTFGGNSCNATTTKFAAEMCVLSDVVKKLTADLRVGLMLANEKGGGAYIRYAIRNMGTETAVSITNRDAMAAMFKDFEPASGSGDKTSSSQPLGFDMYEVYQYFAAKDAFKGWGTDTGSDTGARRRDWSGNNAAGILAGDIRGAQTYGADASTAAFGSKVSKTYQSPILSGCQKNFLIVIGNGDPGSEPTGGTDPATLLRSIGGDPTQIKNLAGSTLHPSLADEFAKYFYQNDFAPGFDEKQNIITYTVAVFQPTGYLLPPGYTTTAATCPVDPATGKAVACKPLANVTDQKMRDLLNSMALNGGGKYFDGTDATKIKAAFDQILNEVQAVNSVFVSASLPVSVNTQGTFLNQVYMGMFRPDTGPRWLGNLREYKILQDASTGKLFLADSANVAAVNPATGFISPTTVSYWTTNNPFWARIPTGAGQGSDSPDGEIVEKGGAGEQLRVKYASDQSSRPVYTCPIADGLCLPGPLVTTFDATTLLAVPPANFKVATATELAALVNWIRGTDNVVGKPCKPDPAATPPCTWDSAEKGPGWPTTIRPSIHGDVLHSRPVVLNYPSTGPFIFYGANDGFLRGTKGGRLGTDGNESWAFVAPEFYPQYRRLRDTIPVVKFPTTSGTLDPPAEPKGYFFDGPIGSYQAADNSAAYIFVTARRGGRMIYGFDVTDPTTPKFLWKISSADPDFKELGQTWSEPKSFKVRASADPVIMFGAGYDPEEDKASPGTRTMGRGVYVANARTGKLIKFFQKSDDATTQTIKASVPSDVAVIDHDFNTFADRAYVGDMAGNVWRFDIDDADPGNWKMYQFASLGAEHKFFFRPDVVISKTYDLVLLGSGDREKPTFLSSTDNFYMLKDDKIGLSGAGLALITPDLLVKGGLDAGSARGWYVPMRSGEKVVNAPLAIGGVVYFSSNRPTPDEKSCNPNLGEARAYALDFLTGSSGRVSGSNSAEDLSTKLTGGGLPPSPVGGVVQLDDGKLVDFIIGSGAGGSPIAPEQPPRTIPKVRKKLYWNTNSDK